MKKLLLPSLVSSLSMAILGLASTPAFAQVTPPAVVTSFSAQAQLAPPVVVAAAAATTTTTPPPVSGSAEVESVNVDGVVNSEVEVSTRGLAADTYTVAVKKKSDGSSVTIGTFVVTAPVVSTGRHHEGFGDGSRNGRAEFSTRAATLPATFNAMDVASLSVSGSAGTVALTGDLTMNTRLVKRIRMVADASVPTASGIVTLASITTAGVTTPRFSVEARGLTPAAALQVALDGTDTYPVTVTAHGRVSVSATGVTPTMSVTIHVAAGPALLTATL